MEDPRQKNSYSFSFNRVGYVYACTIVDQLVSISLFVVSNILCLRLLLLTTGLDQLMQNSSIITSEPLQEIIRMPGNYITKVVSHHSPRFSTDRIWLIVTFVQFTLQISLSELAVLGLVPSQITGRSTVGS